MNAITPFRRVFDEAGARAAAAVHADAHISAAMDALSDAMGAIYATRRVLTEAEQRSVALMRNAMVALSHPRNLNEPLMVEVAR